MGTLISSLTKSQISTLFSMSEWVLLVSTIVLVIGIIGESRTPWWRLRHDVYVFLVALGCIGEFVGEAGIFGFSRRLQTLEEAEISQANILAGNAADNATRAKNSADKAETASSGAVMLAQSAHKEANSAIKSVGEASARLGQLRTDTQKLEEAANKTKSDLIDLAVCNAPRVIKAWRVGTGPWVEHGIWPRGEIIGNGGKSPPKSYVDSLVPMAGQKVLIEYVPDAEAHRAALNIALTLQDAKWSVQGPLRVADWLEDGVLVEPPSLPTRSANNPRPEISAYWRLEDAARELVNFLHSYNWQAKIGLVADGQGRVIRDPIALPEGGIRIQVGLYPPAVYVIPPGQQELQTNLDELKRGWEQMQEESKRAREAQVNKFPPEFRKRMEEIEQKWDKESRKMESNEPCQVLNPIF